jgi:uncharacterized protein
VSAVIDAKRTQEYEAVVTAAAGWAGGRADVRALAVVGSWARGEATMDSDVDLVVIVTDTARLLADDDWLGDAMGQPGDVIRRQEWGVLTERRVRLASGLEVELGIVSPAWAACDPVDAGTARVVRDGCIPLVDPDGLLDRLITAAAHQAGHS